MKKLDKFFAALLAPPLFALGAFCQQANQTRGDSSPAAAATTTELPRVVHFDAPARTEIKPQDLPPPFATESARRPSRIVPQPADARLALPRGFKLNVFAEGGFTYPRWMALSPNGDVFVADSRANTVFVLRDADRDGAADERFTFSSNLSQPFGMAFHDGWFYVANTDSVVRFRYRPGQMKAEETAPEKIIELTEGGYNQHWTRNIIFSPDGKKLYVSIGSSGNVDVEKDERRAGISEYNPDGSGYRLYASGLRNPIGLAWNPGTGQLWTAVNERDGLGDDLVPDYVTSVKDGGFYGFPYSYIGQNEEPRRRGENPELVKKAIVPDVLVTSHSAALGIVFYDGKMFPREYQGDAFVALHGSWNREKLTGYKIIRVDFENKKLVSPGYTDFLSGWLPDENSREVWGRPVGLLVHADGSLLVADDGGKKIWRVSYQK